MGGREIVGILKGADPICNLVLDDAVELVRLAGDTYSTSGKQRELGLIICRGPTVLSICDEEGAEINIENQYEQ